MPISYDKLWSVLIQHSMPVFAKVSTGVEVVGSATLTKINGLYFLASAAHVVNSFIKKSPCIFAEEERRFLPLSEIRNAKCLPDPLDLFIAELPQVYLNAIGRSPESFVDIRHLNKPPFSRHVPTGETIGLVGYPCTQNRSKVSCNPNNLGLNHPKHI